MITLREYLMRWGIRISGATIIFYILYVMKIIPFIRPQTIFIGIAFLLAMDFLLYIAIPYYQNSPDQNNPNQNNLNQDSQELIKEDGYTGKTTRLD